MALFNKKKGDHHAGEGAADKGAFTPDAAKAEKFFGHARAMHEAGNYDYAVTLWLQGLRQDPTSMTALESFFSSAQEQLKTARKPGPTKDQSRAFEGKTPVDKLAIALLGWGTKPMDASSGIKAVEALGKLDLAEPAYWVGERVLRAVRAKPKKDQFVKLKDQFIDLEIFDLAVAAGQDALTLDPSDGPLDAEVRNLSAQAAMSKGGYEQTGEKGGFRANIRDADAQRQLIEQEALARGEDVVDRVVNDARKDYMARSTDTSSIMKYAKALQDRGTSDDLKTAYQVMLKAYEETREFRFRQGAGDIRIKVARRKLSKLRDRAEAPGADEKIKAGYEEARRTFAELEIEELKLRVEAYPTNLSLKYELGRRYFDLDKFEDAIQFFQEAQNDPKNRTHVQSYLGRSFQALGWQSEAVEMLRTALNGHNTPNDDLGLELRYALMLALKARAETERNKDAADEALKLASKIAMQQIGYQNVRQEREALQTLAQELAGS